MSAVSVCNAAAWFFCAVVALLLFGDFIKTELRLAAERKAEVKKEVNDEEPSVR